jgi:hypothetical protein
LMRPFWITCKIWAAKPDIGNRMIIVAIPTNELNIF